MLHCTKVISPVGLIGPYGPRAIAIISFCSLEVSSLNWAVRECRLFFYPSPWFWCMYTHLVDFVVIDSRCDDLMTVFQKGSYCVSCLPLAPKAPARRPNGHKQRRCRRIHPVHQEAYHYVSAHLVPFRALDPEMLDSNRLRNMSQGNGSYGVAC